MKKIQGVIRPHKLPELEERLRQAGVTGMTISEVRGFGRTGGKPEVYRGSAYVVDFVPKLNVEVVVPDTLAADVIDTFARASKTGKIGDGKIFVSSVGEVIRVRTGERGDDAL